MKNILNQDDENLVKDKIKQFEIKTGCELLLVLANASDPYPAATLRFAVLSSFLISIVFSLYFEFHHSFLWPLSFFMLFLFMAWLGRNSWAKKMALSHWEVERESKEKAIEYFHTLGTSKTSHKITAMIMVSTLEKRILVLVDEKLKERIGPNDLNELIDIMKKNFKSGNMGLGFVQSIQILEDKIIEKFNGKVTNLDPDELIDIIHYVTN